MTDLATMLDSMGLPAWLPEPEVVQPMLAQVRCKSLAKIIADLVNANEPMLRASADGATVTVREIGDSAVMRFTILEGE